MTHLVEHVKFEKLCHLMLPAICHFSDEIRRTMSHMKDDWHHWYCGSHWLKISMEILGYL